MTVDGKQDSKERNRLRGGRRYKHCRRGGSDGNGHRTLEWQLLMATTFSNRLASHGTAANFETRYLIFIVDRLSIEGGPRVPGRSGTEVRGKRKVAATFDREHDRSFRAPYTPQTHGVGEYKQRHDEGPHYWTREVSSLRLHLPSFGQR
jgi:hypothetical protein